jgi:hypothetical protein
MSMYTMISAIMSSNHSKKALYLHIRDITNKVVYEHSIKSTLATGSNLAYIRGVDYKGLNESVTFAF